MPYGWLKIFIAVDTMLDLPNEKQARRKPIPEGHVAVVESEPPKAEPKYRSVTLRTINCEEDRALPLFRKFIERNPWANTDQVRASWTAESHLFNRHDL